MGYTIGGATIEQYKFENGWGVNPSGATGVALPAVDGNGDPIPTGLGLGDYVVFTYGSISFYGLISELKDKTSTGTGLKQHFAILDNRLRLAGQIVFGQWNMEEVEWGDANRVQPGIDASQYASSSGTHGSDGIDSSEGLDAPGAIGDGGTLIDPGFTNERRRGYYSILPDRHGAQIKMWHDEPLTVKDILNSAFNGAIGSFGFNRSYHIDQNMPLLNVDANNGVTLANLVSSINRDTGLDVTIDGQRSLRWDRRGTGVFVLPSYPDCMGDYGSALSREATKITVVGERALVQLNNVELEPDWVDEWEPFVSEVVWLREVEEVWGIDISTNEGLAERAALARHVTLADYVKEKTGDQSSMHDFRRWGDASRMMIPVWTYVNEIVYRSYRIPVDNEYKGVPLSSMDIVPGLLAAVELSGTGATAKIDYRSAPVEFYPDTDAFVVAKGQPVELLDERSFETFGRRRELDLREEWLPQNGYQIDFLNKSILFDRPVFLDGDPDEGESILAYPNRGEVGYTDISASLTEGKDLLDVVVPNPDYVISPAEVKVSLVFAMGKFLKQYGTGMNRGIHHAPNLAMHLLDNTGGLTVPASGVSDPGEGFFVPTGGTTGLKEILYESGDTVEDQADEVADSVVKKPSTHLSGSYKRYGSAGTVLASYHSSVRVDVKHGGGMVETVSLSKETSATRLSAYEIEERQRNRELFPKQRELANEVKLIKMQGKIQGNKPVRAEYESKGSVGRIMSNPVGDNSVSTAVIGNKGDVKPGDDTAADKWNAGHVMWLDDESKVDNSGTRFGGIVVSGDGNGDPKVGASYAVAKSGEVPCLVQGPFKSGDLCGCDDAENFCKVSGARTVGIIASGAEYTGGDKVMAMVRIGLDGEGVSCVPWKPTYKNEGTDELPDWKLYIDIGTINGVLNDDWNVGLDVTTFADLYYVVADVSFTDGEVSQIDYSLESTIPDAGDLDPMAKSVLPSSLKIILGSVKAGKACMNWDENLSVESFDALHEPKATVTLGELPYHIWWKYIVKGV